MEYSEGKQKFIQTWGTLGSYWGINRTMAQIHALLLLSCHPLCSEQIKNELKISTGNANMNIRSLLDWGLLHKELVQGERKEYFRAEKDMGKILSAIIAQRKKRELEPLLDALNDLKTIEPKCECSKELSSRVNEMLFFAQKANTTLDMISKADQSWLLQTLFKTY